MIERERVSAQGTGLLCVSRHLPGRRDGRALLGGLQAARIDNVTFGVCND